MTDKHSPAPWQSLDSDGKITIFDDELGAIATIHEQECAAIICAAPDMLKALRDAEISLAEAHEAASIYGFRLTDDELKSVRAAINKAEGRDE